MQGNSTQIQLVNLAKYLAQLLQTQVKSSPAQPSLILSALRLLLPDAQQFWDQIQAISDDQQQWAQIIGFIQNQILQEDQQLGFQKLDTQQFIQVYKIIIQMVQQAIQNDQQQDQQPSQAGQTGQGQDQKVQKVQQRSVPNQSLQYLAQVKRQQQQKKKMLKSKQQKHQSPNHAYQNQKSSDLKSKRKSQKIKDQNAQQERPKSRMTKKKQEDKPKKNDNQQSRKVQKKSKSVIKKNTNNRPVSAIQHQRTSKIEKPGKSSHAISNFQQQLIKQVVDTIKYKNPKKKSTSQIKSNTMFRHNQGTQVMQKAKRKFEFQLKDHKKYLKFRKTGQQLKKKQQKSKIQKQKPDQYTKYLQKKQQKLDCDVVSQQLKYYHQLRDKKIAYIKHMHKLMQKLERQRNLDLHKKQKQLQIQQKSKITKKIQQADNIFDQNIKQLKNQYQKKRQIQSIKTNNQINILKEMDRKLQKNKENQINIMKTLWEQERLKLDLIAKDQENMKAKLQEIYRKHNP